MSPHLAVLFDDIHDFVAVSDGLNAKFFIVELNRFNLEAVLKSDVNVGHIVVP